MDRLEILGYLSGAVCTAVVLRVLWWAWTKIPAWQCPECRSYKTDVIAEGGEGEKDVIGCADCKHQWTGE